MLTRLLAPRKLAPTFALILNGGGLRHSPNETWSRYRPEASGTRLPRLLMDAPSFETLPFARPPKAPSRSPLGTSISALASQRSVAASVPHWMKGWSPPGVPIRLE